MRVGKLPGEVFGIIPLLPSVCTNNRELIANPRLSHGYLITSNLRSVSYLLNYVTGYLMATFFWTGYSNKERTIAISEIEKVINTFGYITDFKLFSDTSISIKIELEELNIDKLYEGLRKNLVLDSFDLINSSGKADRVIFLNITFGISTGNKTNATPGI